MIRSDGDVTFGMTRLRSRNWCRPVAVMVALGVAAICSGCGGSDPAGSGSTSSTSASTTTNPQTGAVVAAYRAEQAAFSEAVLTANAYLPELAATMTNPQLQLVERNLLGEQHDGVVGTGSVQLHPRLVSVSGNQAVVKDCLYSTQELVYAATRKPVPPVMPPEHDGVRSVLTQDASGTWKVSQQAVTEGHCPSGY